MESDKIIINGYTLSCYNINTLIIGSGAASLNAAVNLHKFGQEDLIIATSLWGGGTSNNAGSDKQTYYKLSLSGKEPDSVAEMAMDLFNGHCMHGDIALCEAQGSVQAFLNLVGLGVKFPHDKYGSWAGYKTDHDPRARATSVGPYTSRKMFEALGAEVKRRKIKVLDNHHCIALLTDRSGSHVTGAIAVNTAESDHTKAFVLFNSVNIILGTGGPAGIYETSVYPLSLSGSIGMALLAGATAQNLTESQFGIASLKFRWNLSGSYQQAIPRYISTDSQGKDEKEFLNEFFPDLSSLTRAIFLKGYQWPFDPRKIKEHGSSLIDILVHREINDFGRNVYLDYTRSPAGINGETFSLDNLDSEVEKYLRNSGGMRNTPIERLLSINAPAVSLYKEHGIDLGKEYLQIAVCAQHNNGGLKADIWWESDLRHLFPVGEVNGSHGVYRPGGSALNAGQVGSYRAALCINKKYKMAPPDQSLFLAEVKESVTDTLNLSDKWISKGNSGENKKYLSEIRKRMSDTGGIIRDLMKSKEAVNQAEELNKKLKDNIGACSVRDIADAFLLTDHCLTHLVYLKSVSFYLENGGRSRGSYIVTSDTMPEIRSGNKFSMNAELCSYDREAEYKILEIIYKDQKISMKLLKPREIPIQDLWFEKVWKEYLEDNYPDC